MGKIINCKSIFHRVLNYLVANFDKNNFHELFYLQDKSIRDNNDKYKKINILIR